MNLVIDIKKEVYKSIQDNYYCGISNADMYNAIKNGTPLTENTDAISRAEVLDLIDSKDPNYEVRHFKEDVECLDPIYTCTEDIPCTRCQQYDKEKHYCPHFCQVIRDVFVEKRGRWEKAHDEYSYWYKCSRCGEKIPKNAFGSNYFSPYCPECGCRMMEVEE